MARLVLGTNLGICVTVGRQVNHLRQPATRKTCIKNQKRHHQMWFSSSKWTKMGLRPGLCSGRQWRNLTMLPRHPSWISKGLVCSLGVQSTPPFGKVWLWAWKQQ